MSFVQRVSYNTDNAYKWPGSGTWYNAELEIGNTDFGAENGYLRWRNVTIPNGATITSAYVTLSKWSDITENLSLQIKGIDEDNTADFTNDASSRSQTTAYVNWAISTDWSADTEKTSPDIKTVIQEIIDRAEWSSGNSLAIRVNDNGSSAGNYGQFNAYPDESSLAPQLTINYNDPSTTTTTSSSTSSTTTTSTTTSTSRTTLNHGIKASKEGFDVESEKNLKNFIFHSARGVYGFRSIQEVTIVTNASGEASGEITHDFGYVPQCIVSVQNYDDIRVMVPNDWKYYRLNGSKETIEGSEGFTYQVDATKVYVQATVSEYNMDLDTTDYPSGQSYTFRIILLFNEISEEV